jgi:CheY-like chemotaxis protein
LPAVLVVDDEPAILALVRSILSKHGVQVALAASACDALDVLKNANFDAVLADVVMPGMGGVELRDHLASRRPDLPVMLMSAWVPEPPLAANSLFLSKPFSASDLMGKMAAILPL